MQLFISGGSQFYYLKNLHESESDEEVADILFCFLKENEVLLFQSLEENLNKNLHRKDNVEKKIFIEERVVFKSDEWIYPHKPFNETYPEYLWYMPRNREEVQIATKSDWNFACIVVQKGSGIRHASYVLHVFEDIDSVVLCIEEKITGDFLKNVYPKLKAAIKHGLEVRNS